MTLTRLNPKPLRYLYFSKWVLVKKCSCNSGCKGHIFLLNPLCKSGANIESYPIGIDFEQWHIACKQELQAYQDLLEPASAKKKKIYTPKSKTKKKTKIFGKFS